MTETTGTSMTVAKTLVEWAVQWAPMPPYPEPNDSEDGRG